MIKTNSKIVNKLLFLFFLIVANVSLFSCSSQTKLTCEKIENIVTNLNLKVEPALGSENIEEIEAIAQEFEMTSEALLAVKTHNDFLRQSTENLALIYQEYGGVTRDFLRAFSNKNTEDAIAFKQAVNELFTKQEQLLAEIRNYCQDSN